MLEYSYYAAAFTGIATIENAKTRCGKPNENYVSWNQG
jgi:hypothetical protein